MKRRAVLGAACLLLLAAVASAQEVPVALETRSILPVANRQGAYTSSSVTIAEDLAPAGTNWVALVTDWSDTIAQDPATSFSLWVEWWSPTEGIWRAYVGSPQIVYSGGPHMMDVNGRRVAAFVLSKEQLLGRTLRVQLDCRVRLRMGLKVEFYDVF